MTLGWWRSLVGYRQTWPEFSTFFWNEEQEPKAQKNPAKFMTSCSQQPSKEIKQLLFVFASFPTTDYWRRRGLCDVLLGAWERLRETSPTTVGEEGEQRAATGDDSSSDEWWSTKKKRQNFPTDSLVGRGKNATSFGGSSTFAEAATTARCGTFDSVQLKRMVADETPAKSPQILSDTVKSQLFQDVTIFYFDCLKWFAGWLGILGWMLQGFEPLETMFRFVDGWNGRWLKIMNLWNWNWGKYEFYWKTVWRNSRVIVKVTIQNNLANRLSDLPTDSPGTDYTQIQW